jgi:hypothetical protein
MEEVNPQSGKRTEGDRDIIIPIDLCFTKLSLNDIGAIVILYSMFKMSIPEQEYIQKNLFFLATVDDLSKRGIISKDENGNWGINIE